MKGKKGVEWEFSQVVTLIIIIVTLVILLVIYILASGKGEQIWEGITNLLRFG